MKTEKFDVTGMTCASCVAHVEKTVGRLDGVKSVNVNLLTNSMVVTFDELNLTPVNIEKTVEKAGYNARLQSYELNPGSNPDAVTDFVEEEQNSMRVRWWISFAFLLPLMYFSMAHMLGLPYLHILNTFEYAFMNAFIQLWLALPIVYVNRKYFFKGFSSLLRFAPNMDSLIAIGASAALGYGLYGLYRIQRAVSYGDMHTIIRFTHDLYFESAATILTLITLGKYLEARSKRRTSDAIKRLMNLAPKVATVLRHKVEFEIPVEEVVVNDIVVVRPGQQVPVDGVVYSGSSSVDESALTGESMPVFKERGAKVLSASINKSGYFTMKATKVGKDTTLAQIIQLVEDASASKAPISKLADKISAVFVPVVIGIAMLSAGVWIWMGYNVEFALSIGIAVLVISCPCALGLATPVAIMVGTGKGAEHGILIKSAESLQLARHIDTIVLDKTGTLTEGKPQVTDIITGSTITDKALLELAASLEKLSEHPLAEAILAEAHASKIHLKDVTDFLAIPGQGIEGRVDGKLFRAGNLKLMNNSNVQLGEFSVLVDKLADEGKTPLFVANETGVLGIIAVADVLKQTSVQAVKQLQSMGLNVVMLTGDNARTAAAIQAQLGISTVIAEVLPQDKDKEISKLQEAGHVVAMVGDGINDAPALMRSNLGIAIGAGTDVAIESADIVLMRSDLLDAVTTLRLSKAVMANIKQNLFWAFFYNVIGIPLAAGVFYLMLDWKLNPMFAAAAMSFSSVTVVLNALRLLRFKPLEVDAPRDQSTDNDKIMNKPVSTKINKQTINFKYIMSEKTLDIKGMSCGHCSARVEKALNAIDGVEAKVDLEANQAKVTLSKEVSDETLKTAVDNVGYEVVSVK